MTTRTVWLIVALTALLAVKGLSQEIFVARAQDGRTAWAIVREWAAGLTEVYVADRGEEPRRLRVFPGRPERLAWDGDHLIYVDRGLRLSLLAEGPGRAGVDVALVPGQRWAIPFSDGEDLPALDVETAQQGVPAQKDFTGRNTGDKVDFDALPDVLRAAPEWDVQRALEKVKEGFNLAMMAYSVSQEGDFKGASVYYRQAADCFERMPALIGEMRLSKAVCQSYAEAMRRRRKAKGQDMGRTVCVDHLTAIGGFLKDYAAAHSGRFPEDLRTLKAWVERQYRQSEAGQGRGVVAQMFRSPIDSDERKISYGYCIPEAGSVSRTPVVWSLFYVGRIIELVRSGDSFQVVDRPVGQVQEDSLVAVGLRALGVDSLTWMAVEALEGATRVAPNSARAHAKLGYAYFKTGEIERAEKSFQRAINLDRRLAEAHHGMGLVFTKRTKGLYVAVDRFQEALKWDPKYVEARYHLAEIRMKMKEYDAGREAEKVLALDPTYAPAYRLMGEWYEEQEDYENAAFWYARYLAMRPDDVEARVRLGKSYLMARDFERTTQVLMDYVQQHPEEVHALPILAQACFEAKRLDWVQAFYQRYLNGILASERALYEDIRLVAYPDELVEYEAAVSGGRREEFLRRFWARRDPDLITPINERLLEHYRRVWYACQNFSEGKQPWDRRGEIYVRFGEPDHRSRSNMVNFRQSLEVQRVKERMAQALYGKDAEVGTYIGPVYPVKGPRHYDLAFTAGEHLAGELARLRNEREAIERRTAEGGAEGQTAQEGPSAQEETEQFNVGGMGVEGNFSATATAQEGTSLVRWESWVYTKVGGGIEITFTDELGTGNFDYAPQVLDARVSPERLQKFNWYAPRRLAERAVATAPDYYTPRVDAPPFKFYYDVADFRGAQEGRSALEVYYGIPRMAGRYFPEQDSTRMVVERQVALLDLETGATYRTQSELVFQGAGDLAREPGAFVPDVARLEVPPGRYRLEVSAKDRLSGKMGTYRQDVQVADYAKGRLRLSSLELAWQVSQGQEGDKFTRHGMRIIPLPTRMFRKGQNVFAYYEVYNLQPDASGLTHHSVEYTIKTEGGGIFSKVFSGFAGKRPEVAVSQAQAGTQEAEYRYIELDLQGMTPGKCTLTVTVKDLNSGQAVARELAFTMAE
jgi:GWxTD domain-containing protein